MGRPSLKAKRRKEILNAFEACVAKFGLEGATLEKIAAEAGLARALIRHNMGNREELVESLVERFLERSQSSTRDMHDNLPDSNQLSTLIEWLFDPNYSDPQTVLVSEALIAASANDPSLAHKMRQWTNDFISGIEKVIIHDFPNAPQDRVAAVAAGITGIYFTVESMSPLGGIKSLSKNAKHAVELMITTLET